MVPLYVDRDREQSNGTTVYVDRESRGMTLRNDISRPVQVAGAFPNNEQRGHI